jgi:hypothetical protein
MNGILGSLLLEVVNIVGVTISTLIMRWLLGLSTLEKDIWWIKETRLWKIMTRLQFYRGFEYIHQVRGQKYVYSVTSS